jgi:predicted amidohydrolase
MNDMTHVTVGVTQLTCRLGDKAANLAMIESCLAQASGQAQLVCLPELCTTGYDLEQLGDAHYALAETIPGPTTDRLRDLARDLRLGIVAGIIERDPQVTGLLYDTAVLLNRNGELVGRYRKSHLYPAEHRYFRAGDELPVFDLDGLRVGVAICFEEAFPHIFTTLALRGAQLILNPSAVPVGFGHLQDVRTRARAQDNQFFVAAANHVGKEGKVSYCGRSQIADPRGEVIAMASEDASMLVMAELPLGMIADQRRQEPVFRGLRPELYALRKPE